MQVNRLDRHMNESMAGMAGDSKVANVSSSLQNSYVCKQFPIRRFPDTMYEPF